MNQLTDFHAGTTVMFTALLRLNAEAVDVRNDTVKLILSRQRVWGKESPRIEFEGDTSGGSSGVVEFELTPEQTGEIEPGVYDYEITWERQDQEFVPEKGVVRVLPRL